MGYWIFICSVGVIAVICAIGIAREDLTDAICDVWVPRFRAWARDRWIDRTAGRLATEGLIVVRTGEARPIERDASCIAVVKSFYEAQK